MIEPADTPPSARSLAQRIRRIYLGGRTGRLEIAAPGGGRRQLFFLSGELYLPGAHPLAVLIEPHLAARRGQLAGETSEPVSVNPELAGLMARIASTVSSWEGGEWSFHEGRQELPRGVLGPLPTPLLVMDQAVEGHDAAVLRARLGSEEGRFRAVRSDPEIARIVCLDPEELRLLEELRTPKRLGDVLSDALGAAPETPGGTPRVVRRLCRLEAVGLLERLPGPGRDISAEDVTRVIVQRFAARVGERLEEQPLKLDPETHRREVADLLARLGDLNHYQLLELPVDVAGEKVWDAYERLARRVHPSHAQGLELEGREGIFEILFERATEAYLTLSDPRRRARYDRDLALPVAPLPKEEERREEKRKLARRYYQQAVEMADSEDFHFVVELLKQAVRQDPQPEYYALMGQVQAKNEHPQWQRHAVDSLRRALRLGSTDPGVRLVLARLLEGQGRKAEAAGLYQEILESQPDAHWAQEALSRLSQGPLSGSAGPWWRRLLGG